uniref:Plastid lipid-associated protein/fibrillin conserved domain-containing protein n=1 Tax=Dunaliella tertiolecta TaxID=3047 RepID=A0A7S3VUD6_DUNTE|mmetsp:Transcript_28244/g.76235  ORF Transcript_28244/g.76235 Transcript_28244/m.76235 type:complete len:244 (-) Transcript_28244:413-1144(-)
MRCQRPNKVPCRSNLQPCSAANALRTHRPPNYPRILTFSSVNGAVQTAPSASPEAQAVKAQLLEALQGTDRGIFGTTAAKKAAINDLVASLEALNPVAAPIDNLHLCAGSWELLYSTITITGVKRTKLGLREFIQLEAMLQDIDLEKKEATNVVQFSVSGLSQFRGALSIRAGYEPASPSRVNINFQEATLAPAQLQKLFEKNYDLLLSIFNPQGYLDITYLDDQHRLGRDDKGNLFVLQRAR